MITINLNESEYDEIISVIESGLLEAETRWWWDSSVTMPSLSETRAPYESALDMLRSKRDGADKCLADLAVVLSPDDVAAVKDVATPQHSLYIRHLNTLMFLLSYRGVPEDMHFGQDVLRDCLQEIIDYADEAMASLTDSLDPKED